MAAVHFTMMPCKPYAAYKAQSQILQCAVPENIHTPPTENFLGVGGSVRPKNLKKCMKLNWNFQRGGRGEEVLENIPSVGEVWIFSGITQYLSLY